MSRYDQAVDRSDRQAEAAALEISKLNQIVANANTAIEKCDQSTFDDAMADLLWELGTGLPDLLEDVSDRIDELNALDEDIETSLMPVASAPFAKPEAQHGEAVTHWLETELRFVKQALQDMTALHEQVAQLLVSTRDSRRELQQRWEEKCSKPAAAVQPGAEVAKGDIVLVDEKTQQHIGGGQVFIIPQDKEQPTRTIPVRPDGHATIPKLQPGDRVVFVPQCHKKFVRDGGAVNNGGQMSVRRKPLLAWVDLPCHLVSASGVHSYFLEEYGVVIADTPGAWTTVPYSGPANVLSGLGEWCVIAAVDYRRIGESDNNCAVPTEARTGGDTPGPTRPGDDRTIPKNGETMVNDGGRTVIVNGDQPREIQGPPPNDPHATSRGRFPFRPS